MDDLPNINNRIDSSIQSDYQDFSTYWLIYVILMIAAGKIYYDDWIIDKKYSSKIIIKITINLTSIAISTYPIVCCGIDQYTVRIFQSISYFGIGDFIISWLDYPSQHIEKWKKKIFIISMFFFTLGHLHITLALLYPPHRYQRNSTKLTSEDLIIYGWWVFFSSLVVYYRLIDRRKKLISMLILPYLLILSLNISIAWWRSQTNPYLGESKISNEIVFFGLLIFGISDVLLAERIILKQRSDVVDNAIFLYWIALISIIKSIDRNINF